MGVPGSANINDSTLSGCVDAYNIALGLKKYKGSVYLVQGRQDPMDASTAFEIRNILPGTVIHFVEKSGHFPWLEGDDQATDFFTTIKQWLRQP